MIRTAATRPGRLHQWVLALVVLAALAPTVSRVLAAMQQRLAPWQVLCQGGPSDRQAAAAASAGASFRTAAERPATGADHQGLTDACELCALHLLALAPAAPLPGLSMALAGAPDAAPGDPATYGRAARPLPPPRGPPTAD